MSTLDDQIDALFSNEPQPPTDDANGNNNKVEKKERKRKRTARRKRKRKRASDNKVVEEDPAAAVASAVKDTASVGKYTVPAGTRKSKVRQQVPTVLETAAAAVSTPVEEQTVPPLAPGMMRSFGDMPSLDGPLPFALDDWTQRYRNSESQTATVETRRRSVASAIRESLRAAIEEREQKSDSSDTDDEEGAVKPAREEITIEDFFSGDVDTPLVGSAVTMYDMLAQLRADIERRETVSRQAAQEADAAADESKEKKKTKKRRKKKKRKGRGARDPKTKKRRKDDEGNVVAEVAGDDLVLRHLEPCSKAYCADFFREPRGEELGERGCKRGSDCMFIQLATRYPNSATETTNGEGFVCREFLRPSELDAWLETGKLPAARRLCLGCERMLTTFYYYLYQSRGESPVELIQTHYNLVDEPGEYDAARCLYPNPDASKWTGVARPFVEFAPNTFVPAQFEMTAETTGRRWVLLGAVEKMTDFRLSPSRYYMAAAEEAAEVELRRAGNNSSVEEAANGGLPQDPRGAWVSGPAGAVMCGVPPCRPLRPPEWIESEALADPPAPGFQSPRVLVPRILLGQAFPNFAKYVFCPFADTLAETRQRPSNSVIALSSKLMHSPSLHSFDAGLLNAVYKYGADRGRGVAGGTATRYAVLLAVLYRVEFASRLVGRSEDRRYDYWVQLFIDTHIDLCIAMHETGLFDDAVLESSEDNPSSVSETLLEQNYPHDTRCAHAGDLPDLSTCIQFASVWFQVRAKSRADNVAEALVHLVACKTQTHKCQVRNFAHIAFTYAQQFPQIMTLFRALITVSLLGNYPHARKHPEFETRLHITYSMRRITASDRELFLWITENEQLMYAIVKEYYSYLVSHRPAFEAVLEETTHWATVREYICDAMDRARAVSDLACEGCTLSGLPYRAQRQGYAGHGPPLDFPWNAGAMDSITQLSLMPEASANAQRNAEAMCTISDDMHTLHEFSELPLITKLRKGTFTNMILPEMTRFFMHSVLDDHVVRPQSSLLWLAKIEEDGVDAAVELVRAMRLIVEKRVPQQDSREPIELGWLSYLGVTSEGLAALRALCYDYETKDIADNSIDRRIRAIFDRNQRDFFVMHTFFKIVADWRSTASFKLPLCYAQTQSAVLRAKSFTPPWKPLRPEADVFFYCFPTDDMQVLTSRGFMFYEELKQAWEQGELSDGRLALAGYDPERDQLIYETPQSFVDNEPDEGMSIFEFTSQNEQAHWGGDTSDEARGDYVSALSNCLSIRVTSGHDVYVRRGQFAPATNARAGAFIPDTTRMTVGSSRHREYVESVSAAARDSLTEAETESTLGDSSTIGNGAHSDPTSPTATVVKRKAEAAADEIPEYKKAKGASASGEDATQQLTAEYLDKFTYKQVLANISARCIPIKRQERGKEALVKALRGHLARNPSDQLRNFAPSDKAEEIRVRAPFGKEKAEDLYIPDASTRGASRLGVQFLGAAGNGVQGPQGLTDRIPFTNRLRLDTREKVSAFLQLYGFWLGDGSFVRRKSSTGRHVITFAQVKQHDIDWLLAVLATLEMTGMRTGPENTGRRVPDNVAYVIGPKAPGTGQQRIAIYDEVWAALFFDEYGAKYAGNGTIPTQEERERSEMAAYKPPEPENIKSAKWFARWVWRLNRAEAYAVLSGLRRADGTQAPRKPNADGGVAKDQNYIYTSSTRFRDEITRLALHAGCTTTFRRMYAAGTSRGADPQSGKPIVANHDSWVISFITETGGGASHPSMYCKDIKKDDTYRGRTWCFTMPSGFLIARRTKRESPAEDSRVVQASRPVVVGNCPACMRWLSDTIETDDPSTRENMYSANFSHTLYSHDTGNIYCDRQKVSVNTRKQVESGRYEDVDAHVDDVRAARRVRHYLSTPLCCSIPAVPVHMLGRCQRLGGKLWALCECCSVITQWDGSKFGPNGFTCGFHTADAPRTMTAFQAENVRLRELRTQLPPAEKCSFCRNDFKPGEDYAQTTVIDDCGEYLGDDDDGEPVRSTPTWTYLTFVLCRVDGAAVHVCQDPVVRRSVLEKSIIRTRHWHVVSSMRRFGHPGL